MKHIDLKGVKHIRRIGEKCEFIEPNITEDCIFYEDDEPIGFYMTKMTEKMCKLADLANNEFRSKNVPKTLLERSDVFQAVYKHGKTRQQAKKEQTIQMSTILGSVPPKPHMRRPYASISSVHSEKKAQKFIKAMLMLAKESEELIKEILPKQYEQQKELFR